MTRADDPRLPEARRKPILSIAGNLGIERLARAGHEMVGPCPKCGGTDRFSINQQKGLFHCRHCEPGGDVIHLVRWMLGMTLPEALEWLCGPRQELTAAQREKLDREARAASEKSRREADRHRAHAIAEARAIWRAARPAEGTPVRDYLALRGLSAEVLPQIPAALRYHPALPYSEHVDGRAREIHRGPAMVAAVQHPDGQGRGVHRTWLDLDRPKGKAVILHPATGKALPAKKGWGSKKGGAIRLHTPAGPWDTLISAEGIETALTALAAGRHPGAAVWCLVDLGNIAGRMQSGPRLKYAGLPDLDDREAFVPPPWVRRWILIEDGDSEPRMTRAKVLAGARRAMATIPGLRAHIVPCPPGADLNDVLMEGEDVERA